jgi:hypothetical protein
LQKLLPSRAVLQPIPKLFERNAMMPDLPGDLREIILFNLEDVKRKIEQIEELLCLSEEEENERS